MSPKETAKSRRNVLKLVASSSLATGALFGTAGASPGGIDSVEVTPPEERVEPVRVVEDISDFGTAADCKTEYKCVSESCKDVEDERAYSRQCCRQGGGYICDEWSGTNQCCY